jgi:hypothetical protein
MGGTYSCAEGSPGRTPGEKWHDANSLFREAASITCRGSSSDGAPWTLAGSRLSRRKPDVIRADDRQRPDQADRYFIARSGRTSALQHLILTLVLFFPWARQGAVPRRRPASEPKCSPCAAVAQRDHGPAAAAGVSRSIWASLRPTCARDWCVSLPGGRTTASCLRPGAHPATPSRGRTAPRAGRCRARSCAPTRPRPAAPLQ